MSSNLDNHKSSVRDIAQLFAKEKRLGTKAADLVNGTALTKCLEINEAFEVLGTPAEQRVAMLASTVFCADTSHGRVVKQAISTQIRKHKEEVPLPDLSRRTPRGACSFGLASFAVYENTIWHLNVQWGDYDSSDILLFVELGQASRVPQESAKNIPLVPEIHILSLIPIHTSTQ